MPSPRPPESAVKPSPCPVPGTVALPSWWRRIGGGSLSVSIGIHLLLILLAIFIVRTITMEKAETVDFLAGGGGGGKGNDAKAAQQRRAASANAPKTRIVSSATSSTVSLPDIQSSLSDFSTLTPSAPAGAGMGGGTGGLRGSRSGGLMGNGRGTGCGPGNGSGFVSFPLLFGQKIDAKRLAVVLDMSGSMYPFLPAVLREVDKVAPGSSVVLHFGCGLAVEDIHKPGLSPTSDKEFPNDRITTDLLTGARPGLNQTQREALYAAVKNRPQTYYVPTTKTGTTWIALMDSKLKDADTIYWFADFADAVLPDRIEEIARKLRSRKQKLLIHPSDPLWLKPGSPQATNVAKIDVGLVRPSGGKVINVEMKKEVPVKAPPPSPKPAAPLQASTS
jgi:hypothetical protein